MTSASFIPHICHGYAGAACNKFPAFISRPPDRRRNTLLVTHLSSRHLRGSLLRIRSRAVHGTARFFPTRLIFPVMCFLLCAVLPFGVALLSPPRHSDPIMTSARMPRCDSGDWSRPYFDLGRLAYFVCRVFPTAAQVPHAYERSPPYIGMYSRPRLNLPLGDIV